MKITPGISLFLASPPQGLKNARLGLLSHPAAVLPGYTQAAEALAKAMPGRVKSLFGPQHGFFAEKQDNMVESDHSTHPTLGVNVWSLYGERRKPAPEWFHGLDALLIDLVDVGCRVYTFFTTMVYCLEEAARQGLKVVVLDRPNPIGRKSEGPILAEEWFSFVGAHAIPLRHGLSMGELAKLVVAEKGLDVDLMVVPCLGWQGEVIQPGEVDWVLPSPNMPTLETALVYPGQVLLEGATLSEGRGTTRPFEIFGNPGLDPWAVAEAVEPAALAGAALRPLVFQPTFHKHAGKPCGGFQLHSRNAAEFDSVSATLAILSAINRVQKGLWEYKEPPYEYEYDRRPIDLLLGDPAVADATCRGEKIIPLTEKWRPELGEWAARVKKHLLY